MKKVFQALGRALVWLFSFLQSAQTAWDKISPVVQEYIIKGSGIVAVLNKYSDYAPDFIFKKIHEKFPAFTKEKLQRLLREAEEKLGLAKNNATADLGQTLKNITHYLNGQTDKSWADASEDAATIFAIILSGKGENAWALFKKVIKHAYENFVKPRFS